MRLGKPLAVGIAEEREAVGPPREAGAAGTPERNTAPAAVTEAADAADADDGATVDAALRLGVGAVAGP
ncbi:hypothetical protein [Streptomyces sp. NPDC017993]|uniref:hypothetical protein n=1 Tax=Streptomyces sp. NPDC017993 TaxID=3365027 RepID=UPI0037BD8701